MTFFRSRLAAAWLVAAGATLAAPATMAQDLELSIIAPAGAGGGWDSAARALQEVMMSTGNARSVQVINVPGAGGTVASISGSDRTRFSWQGMAGVGYQMTEEFAVDLGYRYAQLGKVRASSTTATTGSIDEDLNVHELVLTARYGF